MQGAIAHLESVTISCLHCCSVGSTALIIVSTAQREAELQMLFYQQHTGKSVAASEAGPWQSWRKLLGRSKNFRV